MPKFSLYYHPLYSDGLDRTARFPVDRYRLLAQQIPRLDIEQNIQIKESRLANREEILLVHERDFVDRFLSNSLSEKEIRRIGLKPWKPEIVPRTFAFGGRGFGFIRRVA
jgi:acetoin utilization deacetylase AcuC-like enzyme